MDRINTALHYTSRSTRRVSSRVLRWQVLAAIALSLVIASCRRDRVWSGVKYDHSGKVMSISSAEPFCGCLDAINTSNKPIYLRSRVSMPKNFPPIIERGHMVLAPNEEMKVQFDWAGNNVMDVYELDAWSADGHEIVLRDVLRGLGDGWPYTPCDTQVCPRGSLYLNVGQIHQH